MKKILAASLILCLFSCKKDDELTKENIVGTYKQTDATQNGVSVWNTSSYDACDKDDLTQFKSDNTYQVTDAGTRCSPSNDDNGTWSLNDKTMVIDGQNFSVEKFDGKNLTLKYSETIMGTTYTGTATLVKQ